MAISQYEKEKRVIGKLWLKEGQYGPYMTGFLQDCDTGEKVQDVVVFGNKKRPDKNDPDWLIQESKKLDKRPQQAPSPSEDEAPW